MSEYNGWTNYETWNVNLWLSNDEYTYRQAQRIIRLADTKYEAEKALEEYVTDPENGMVPDIPASMAADLLGAALDAVNWREIVDHEWDELHDDTNTAPCICGEHVEGQPCPLDDEEEPTNAETT